MDYRLLKVHGSQNTFYMLEAEDRDYGRLAAALASLDSEADGLLLVTSSETDAAKMRVFNRDGSEASMCGNGLRCVARFVCERDGLEEATIETMKASLHVRKEQELGEGVPTYAVEISPVLFNLESLPLSIGDETEWFNRPWPSMQEEIPFSAVAVPNPHLIGIVPPAFQADPSHQEKWATHFNGENEYFSDGVNVSYVTPVDDGIFVRTFERGVGFTNACGTAMTASALVSSMTGLVPYGEVTVYNPGGMVKCTVEKKGDSFALELKGNATYVSNRTFEWDGTDGSGRFLDTETFSEQADYERFSRKTAETSQQLLKL